MIQTYPFLKEEMGNRHKNSRLEKAQKPHRQIPNLATTAQPGSGTPDSIVRAPTGLDSPVAPALKPAAHVCSLGLVLLSACRSPNSWRLKHPGISTETCASTLCTAHSRAACGEWNIATTYCLTSAALWNLNANFHWPTNLEVCLPAKPVLHGK